jgi:hypothetical protein
LRIEESAAKRQARIDSNQGKTALSETEWTQGRCY